MEIMVLDNNKLNGSLPGNFIGQMNQLRLLYIQKNLLTDSFPTDVGELKNLNDLIVSDNKLWEREASFNQNYYSHKHCWCFLPGFPSGFSIPLWEKKDVNEVFFVSTVAFRPRPTTQ